MKFAMDNLLVYPLLAAFYLTSSSLCFGQDDTRVFERTGEVVSADTLRQYIESGYAVRLETCSIHGFLLYREGKCSEIRMSHCIVKDSMDLGGTQFLDSLVLRNSIFMQPLHLNGTMFLGCARFDSTEFRGRVNLKQARFRDSAFFAHTVFGDQAVFSWTHFNGVTYFKHAVFKRVADFSISTFADTSWTTFSNSRFNGRADFTFSRFPWGAGFTNVQFTGGADFGGAKFTGWTNFFRAAFEGSHSLTGIGEPGVVIWPVIGSASFMNATLDSICFALANLNGVILERSQLSDFSMKCLAQAKGLAGLRYLSYPEMLAELREYFRENHYRQQEREITCALERHNQPFIKKLLFDLPFEYGSNIAKPFQIVFGIFVVWWAFYYVLFHRRKGPGVYVTVTLSKGDSGESKLIRKRIAPYDITTSTGFRYKTAWLWREFKMLLVAFFYSLISTFNLGFRDIDFGRWLRLILPWKVDFEPFDWVRTISGLQAIFSILLMGFGLLFYFGRFFD